LQIETTCDTRAGQNQHPGDDRRQHLRAEAGVGPLAPADDVDANRGLTEAQHVAVEQLDLVDALAVQPDAVRGAQVLHPDLAVDLADLGVPSGHRAVLYRDVALIRPADHHRDRAHRVGLLDPAWTLHDEVRGYPVEERGIDHLGFRSCFFTHGALSHGARAWKRGESVRGSAGSVKDRAGLGAPGSLYLPGWCICCVSPPLFACGV